MSGAGAAVLAWALLAGALLPPPPVRPQPLPHGDREVHEKEAQFNTTYSDWVHANLLNIYAFNHSVRRNRTEGVRVSVNVLSDQKDQPVLFVVRQKEAVVSFQVPLILRGLYQRKYAYQEVSRTLCQPQTKAEVETQHFYVDVSTLSLNTSYQLRVTRVENFVLRTNERFSFNATAAQPQYFKYEFPEEVDSVIVKVTSAMAFPCSVISIQDILCPVYDLDNNVAFIGMYQTMTKKAAITVQKKDFPSHSFYVVVVVKTEDEACGGALPYYPLSKNASPDEPVDQHNRQKTLEVMVSPAITSEAYVRSVLFCLGIFLSFYILTLLIACWESCRQHKRKGLLAAMDSPSLDTASLLGHSRSIPDSFLNHGPYDSYGYGSFGNGSSSSTEGITDSLGSAEVSYSYVGERSLENVASRPRLDSLSSVEEDDYDTLADIDYDKNVIRTKQYLCVADLARKDKRVLRKKYQIYFWNIATIAVFYALPVIQLVITYQTVVNVTGNQDICYYNFLCAHPLGNLSAFNNILSNLGYVLLGLLFLLIILQREINYNRALLRNDAHALECGIPKHFGLFYAMGTALMMEGLLSACYHVCPNYTNFQFDTSFMYMIAGLCMLKLYQKRHPDINASAYSAYACLALVIFFSVVGVVFGKGNTAFWIVFSVIHIVATLLLSTQLYYMGRWKLDSGILRRILHVLYTDCVRQCSGPMYVDRMVLLVMGNIINWSLAAYGLIVRPNDFASYLLAIGICNLLLYFAFYIIMKLRSGERIKLIPLLCIISTSVVWGFALFFFFQGLSTWQKTPAESREHNRDCILLDFFDDHDIWHFLSSIAMFGSFLVLLTLDDDLDCVQRDKIYVF
ncbi:SID1 transmembrane family member 2 isoform X1 [Pyrgilauda ruficollis]|uniref:SID1 transmembrane family member 2 isoform X1 n=1 Tax=Onychostruthus taczanowskii TaxID=356909 RepID=UPI001B80A939|nr:SID1 transmembrane family member 2 isoform X1 [Onychostruthus taczanowskii]XP_041314092.1 SID1 transmembrane family member 2 isoform X1 [Pyrgilauda ruficollis]